MTDKKKHYVDNEKFFTEMKKWKQRVHDAREVEELSDSERGVGGFGSTGK